MTEMAPVADRRRPHAWPRGAVRPGAPATRTGEHLAAAGAQGAAVAAAYVAAGDATLAEAPSWRRAGTSGRSPPGTPAPAIAACWAEAAALGGDQVAALRLADAVVGDPGAEDRRRALAVVAAAAARAGFWRRSSARRRAAALPAGDRNDAAWPLLATIAVATGGPLEPRPPGTVTASRSGRPRGRVLRLMPASAWSASEVGGRPRADPGGRRAGVGPHPPGPADLAPRSGATVALALCELATAEHLLARARDHDVGGATLRHHHRLGLGWVAVRSGRWSGAQAALDEVAGATLAPWRSWRRPSRRAWPAARATWPGWATPGPAEGVLLRHPADLFSLEIVGELAIGAACLGLWDRVAPKARELGDVCVVPGRAAAVAAAAALDRPAGGAGHRRPGGGDPPGRGGGHRRCTHDWERWRRPPAPGWRSWAATPTPRPWRGGPGPAGAGPDVGGVAAHRPGGHPLRRPSVTRRCWSRPVT